MNAFHPWELTDGAKPVPVATGLAIAAKAEEIRLFALNDLDACIQQHEDAVTFVSKGRGLPRYADPESAIADVIRLHLLDLKRDLEPMILRLAAEEVAKAEADAADDLADAEEGNDRRRDNPLEPDFQRLGQ